MVSVTEGVLQGGEKDRVKLGERWEGDYAAVRLTSLRERYGGRYCSREKLSRGGSQAELEIDAQQFLEEVRDDSNLGDGVACVGDNA